MDRLELVGVKTEQLQDCWGDLRSLYRISDSGPASRSVPYNQDGDIPVLQVITAMLSDLALLSGVDNPVLRDSDHVGYPGIALINADEPRRSGACVYLIKTCRRDGLVVDAGRRIVVFPEEFSREVGGRFRPVVEPEEHAVVIGPLGYQIRGAWIRAQAGTP